MTNLPIDLEYRPGHKMVFAPINVSVTDMIRLLRQGVPQVVILEPGDATRYTLLLLPLDHDNVGAYLDSVGIREEAAERYLFVAKLSYDECPGTWVPFGPGGHVGTYDVTELSDNGWSHELLAWWLTNLNALLGQEIDR